MFAELKRDITPELAAEILKKSLNNNYSKA